MDIGLEKAYVGVLALMSTIMQSICVGQLAFLIVGRSVCIVINQKSWLLVATYAGSDGSRGISW